MYSLKDDFNKFFGLDVFKLNKDENITKVFSLHLSFLAQKVFKDSLLEKVGLKPLRILTVETVTKESLTDRILQRMEMEKKV